MYCPECSSKIPDDSVFCENCGARLNKAVEAEVKPASKAGKPSRKKSLFARSAFWAAVVVLAAGVWGVSALKGKGDGNDNNSQQQYAGFQENGFASETDSGVPSNVAAEPAEKPADPAADSGQNSGEQPDAVAQNDTDENGLASISTEEAAREIVSLMSTGDFAKATDFEWFLDCELYDGFEAGLVISNPGAVNGVQGDEAGFLNGGWKAFLADTLTKPYAPYIERYFNVTIDTDGNRFNTTANWKYMYFPGEGQSKEEAGSDLFEGTWDAESSTATCRSDYGTIVFEHFFIAPDSSAEYATGTFYWISGEVERIALMRTAR